MKHENTIPQYLTKIFENMILPIYWKDKNSVFLGANKAALNTFGYDWTDKIDIKLWGESSAKVYNDSDIYVLKKALPISQEYTHTSLNNTRYFSVNKSPLYDCENHIIGIVVQCIDITLQKKPELFKQLAEETQKHQKIFAQLEKNLSLIPSAFYLKDKEHHFLSINQAGMDYMCFESTKDYLGKTDYDLWPKHFADKFVADDNYVLETGKIYSHEDEYVDIHGNTKYCYVIKAPLYSESGEIIGIIGNSIDITAQKKAERLKQLAEETQKHQKLFAQLEKNLSLIPSSFYLKDNQHRFVGANQTAMEYMGLKSTEDYLGKTDYDIWPQHFADKFVADDNYVLETGKMYSHEDEYVDINGSTKYCYAIKVPLYSESGEVIGIIGNSIDITSQKEAEKLKLESEAHKIYAKEQEKFKKIVGQMAHDIRSPISTLKTVVQTAHELKEQNRITLRRAAINIEDITNHMLNRYKPSDSELTQNNQRQYVLVSGILAEIASERRYEYQGSLIEFEFVVIDPHINNFVFMQIEPSNFRRMISNVLNNAVQALPETGGKVTLKLLSSNEWVEIIIVDNGKGMPWDTLEKIKQKTVVSQGKKDGFGIGLTQVFDVIDSNLGTFNIYSNDEPPNNGTIVTIELPKAEPQQWLATEIKIDIDDIVIILDDDTSIHSAWDSRFTYILEKNPNLKIKHFMEGKEALQFINELADKHNICLLSDYELINQDLNGLDVIQQSGIKRSILVTSHYANPDILKLANQMAIKVLPKELVYSIPIKIERSKYRPGELVNVHMVFVDDEVEVVNRLIIDYYSHLVIDTYDNPFEFLREVDKYPKDTKLLLDNNYYNSSGLIKDMNGMIIAQQLHDKGYTNLYIYSWEKCDVPDYVTLIVKTDRNIMEHLDKL
ncbi:MAG: hypothetical protein QG673_1156 [Pseudomonadota bacterium]|nr:hypothetical protein [Pseudomonadota bacterium]